MSGYLLASHVFYCRTEDHAVLLDLRNNEYLGLDTESVHALLEVVKGSSQSGRTDTKSDRDESGLTRLKTLIDSGVLTADPNTGKDISSPNLVRAARVPIDGYEEAEPEFRLPDLWRLAISYASAAADLRCRSLERVANRLAARKQKRAASAPAACLEAIQHAASVFTRLRPIFFTTTDECLLDSLVLTEFLSRYGIFPHWVIGVETKPFSAHCWVQWHDVVLNDVPENVNRYTPILAV